MDIRDFEEAADSDDRLEGLVRGFLDEAASRLEDIEAPTVEVAQLVVDDGAAKHALVERQSIGKVAGAIDWLNETAEASNLQSHLDTRYDFSIEVIGELDKFELLDYIRMP